MAEKQKDATLTDLQYLKSRRNEWEKEKTQNRFGLRHKADGYIAKLDRMIAEIVAKENGDA